MPNYIINLIPTKKNIHLLHEKECPHIPEEKNCVEIGYFTDCSSALRYLRVKNPSKKFSGCNYCCRSCFDKQA
ncbi:hypothetical protein [Enterococcus faecium]|uniref:hypothetical protein n=1 Tax=Enterococcus faecium TaxID=1352 RepID=UPI0006B26858|nr:hypothetical protein [Enterococcus faecium]OUZ27908.1 hypothetical protein A5806_002517 [Enterococcus faecium]